VFLALASARDGTGRKALVHFIYPTFGPPGAEQRLKKLIHKNF
jgi:hypothetical protein